MAVASAVCGAAVDAADCTSTPPASSGAGRSAAWSSREGSVGAGDGCAMGETLGAEDAGGRAEDVGDDAAGACSVLGPAAADPAIIKTRPPARIPAPARRVFLPSHELRRTTAQIPVVNRYRPAKTITPLNPVVKPHKATTPNPTIPAIFPGPIDWRGAVGVVAGSGELMRR